MFVSFPTEKETIGKKNEKYNCLTWKLIYRPNARFQVPNRDRKPMKYRFRTVLNK